MKQHQSQHIEVNPAIMRGKPVIKGTRIPVYLVLNLLAHGYNPAKIIKAYPELTSVDIEACLKYASRFFQLQEEGDMNALIYA